MENKTEMSEQAKEGWKVAQSSVYNHVGRHRLQRDEEGRFTLEAVDEYARRYLKRQDGSSQNADETAQSKREAEVRRLRAQAELFEMKAEVEKGRYILREQFEQALASRAQLFKTDLNNFATGEAPEIVTLVNGESDKIPDLIEHLQERFADILDRYSRDTEFLV